jgi:hypothetical protein
MENAEAQVERKPERKIKLAYFASHSIQYRAPMLRRLQQESNLDVTSLFFSDRFVRSLWDPGFKKMVEWDVPLLRTRCCGAAGVHQKPAVRPRSAIAYVGCQNKSHILRLVNLFS